MTNRLQAMIAGSEGRSPLAGDFSARSFGDAASHRAFCWPAERSCSRLFRTAICAVACWTLSGFVFAAGSGPDLRDEAVIARIAGAEEQQRMPKLVSVGEDVLVAAWITRGKPAWTLKHARSTDGGKTWAVEIVARRAPETNIFKNNVLYFDARTRAVHSIYEHGFSESSGVRELRGLISKDGGATWKAVIHSQPKDVVSPLLANPIIDVPGGFLLAGHIVAPKGVGTLTWPVVWHSKDLKVWDSIIALTPEKFTADDLQEPALLSLGGSQLLAVFRAARVDHCFISMSGDYGRTWTTPVPDPELPNSNTTPCYIVTRGGQHIHVYNKAGPNGPTTGDVAKRPERQILHYRTRDGLAGRWSAERVFADNTGTDYAAQIVEDDKGRLWAVWESAMTDIRFARFEPNNR